MAKNTDNHFAAAQLFVVALVWLLQDCPVSLDDRDTDVHVEMALWTGQQLLLLVVDNALTHIQSHLTERRQSRDLKPPEETRVS